MKTVLTFIFVFCVIVIIHELGHLIFAKLSGILVREFSIGMGPKLVSHRGKDGTTYTLRMLPLGGYVRMAGVGEEEVELHPGQPVSVELNAEQVITRINTSSRVQLPNSVPLEILEFDLEENLFLRGNLNGDSNQEMRYQVAHNASIIEADGTEVLIAPKDVQFQSAKLYKRMLTNVAGPVFNFILTFVLFIIIFALQGGDYNPDPSSTIGGVTAGGAAETAGIKAGDVITSVDGQAVATFAELSKVIQTKEDQKIPVEITRGTEKLTVELTPEIKTKDDGSKQVMIGIMGNNIKTEYRPAEMIPAAAKKTWEGATGIFVTLKHLVSNFSLNQLGGPVMIFQLSSQVSSQGFITVLGFMALLSVNLGIMNLLPIPGLDGGKLLLNLVEGIRRKPLSPESEGKITLVGVGLLMILMVLVTWNDIMRFFFR